MPLRERAGFLFDRAIAEIDAGKEPEGVVEAYATLLRLADRHFEAGRLLAAAQAFTKASRLAFNRALHLHRTTSPLAADPRGFTAPLRESAVCQRLRAPRGRTGRSRPPIPGQARRVLVVTRENANFLREILSMLESNEGYDVRFLDLATEDMDLLEGADTVRLMAREILTGENGLAERARDRLGPLIEWADVVFVEWCIPHAALLNLIDPGNTRVIIRLHSYEAFTGWPHLLDFSRVDDLLFVSEHLRDLVVDSVPALSEHHAPALHVLPLNKQLAPYRRPKPDDARFTLGLVGWSAAAKDPLWAIAVLRAVRARDARYRLMLVGSRFDDSVSATTRTYGARLWHELDELEADGAVVRVAKTDDVPSVLEGVGVIISTSVRESFHAGLVEGAASGAVPVVRDWPYFAGRATGARTFFPTNWVVTTPEEAAARVLRTTADVEEWRAAGEAASAHTLATWDWEVTRPGYLELFGS